MSKHRLKPAGTLFSFFFFSFDMGLMAFSSTATRDLLYWYARKYFQAPIKACGNFVFFFFSFDMGLMAFSNTAMRDLLYWYARKYFQAPVKACGNFVFLFFFF